MFCSFILADKGSKCLRRQSRKHSQKQFCSPWLFSVCHLVPGLPCGVQAAEWHPLSVPFTLSEATGRGCPFTVLRPLFHSLLPRDAGYSILEVGDSPLGHHGFYRCHLQLLQTGLAVQLAKYKLRQRHVACKLHYFVALFIKLRFAPMGHPLPQPYSCQSGGVWEALLMTNLLKCILL